MKNSYLSWILIIIAFGITIFLILENKRLGKQVNSLNNQLVRVLMLKTNTKIYDTRKEIF